MSSTPTETEEEEPKLEPETKPVPERVPPPKPPKKAPPAAPSYFDDPRAAHKLREEALSWIGTPFREYYQQDVPEGTDLKGMGGGIDCIGLVQEIMCRTGATDRFLFARAPSDYQSHQLGMKILDWMRGRADDPQSKTLGEILLELEFPDTITDPRAETPRDFFRPGDILVMQHGSLFHLPVIYDNDLHFVNAIPRLGVVEGTIQDSTYSKHLVAVFRLKPKQKAES
jgi:cell wall-associated NlpC family hydrolase